MFEDNIKIRFSEVVKSCETLKNTIKQKRTKNCVGRGDK